MKAWRKEASKINSQRRIALLVNAVLPRDKRVPVPATARVQMRERLAMQRLTKGTLIYRNWLLDGLLVRAGIIEYAY